MFTNSSSVKEECRQLGLDVISGYRHNRYGMPYLNHMLLTIRSSYDSRSYGYINSDIVLSEVLIHSLPAILNRLDKFKIQASVLIHLFHRLFYPFSFDLNLIMYRLSCMLVFLVYL